MFVNHNTGYPLYIGKGHRDRDAQHEAAAKRGKKGGRLYYWMRKYHSLNGVWPKPFRVAEGMTEQEAFDLEIGLIAFYGRQDLKTGCLFNLTNGGEGSVGKSPETIAKIVAKRLGVRLSPEAIAKRTASVLGTKRSPETRRRMSEAQKKVVRVFSAERRAAISEAVKARPPASAETRAKLSAACKGKPSWNKGRTIPLEVREKMSIAHKGKIFTKEHLANMSIGAIAREARRHNAAKAKPLNI